MLRLLSVCKKHKILAVSLSLFLLLAIILPILPAGAEGETPVAGEQPQLSEQNLPLDSAAGQDTADPLLDGSEELEILPIESAEVSQPDSSEPELQPTEESNYQIMEFIPPYDPPELEVGYGSGIAGSETAVDVILYNPGKAAGYSFALTYDPQLVEPAIDNQGKLRVAPGDIGGIPEANICNGNQLVIASASAKPGSINPVRLCTIYLNLLAEGDSSIIPEQIEIYDENGQEMSGVTAQNGLIQAYSHELSVPSASPAPGSYDSVQRVSLKTSYADEYIYYTLDNSDPTDPDNPGRQLYDGPVLVNYTLTIKAATYRDECYGQTVPFSYTINLAGISGSVTYKGQPLGGIPVKIKKAGIILNTINTSASGFYIFPALQDGQYVVAAGGSGGFNEAVSQPVVIDSTNRQATENFELFKGGTIKGIVQVPNLYSPQDISVFAQSDSTGSYAAAEPDEAGCFWLEGLKSGADYKVFTRNSVGLSDVSIPDGEGTPLTITDGQLTDITSSPLVIQAAPAALLKGTVTEQSAAVSGVWVSVYSPSADRWGGDDTDINGYYEIPDLIPANDYLISYYKWEDNISGNLEAEQVINANENIIDINIPQGLQITGCVKRDDGTGEPVPVSGLNIWAAGPSWGSAITDASGVYTIKRLTPGTYTVEIDNWSSFDVDTRTNTTVELNETSSPVTHDITLMPGGTIQGKVSTNPAGGQDAVRITAYSSSKNVYRRATTNKEGTFIIRGITPADDYVVAAWKWPYEAVEQANVAVVDVNEPPVCNFTLNHPDLQAGYFKPDSNRYLSMNPSIAPGKTVSFKLDYQNCNPTVTAAGARAEFVLPVGLELTIGSVTLNGNIVDDATTISRDGKNILPVNLGDVAAGQKGTVVFQARHNPLLANALTFTSQASIIWPDNNETIGTAQVEVVAVDINGPTFTKPGKFTVYGKCAEAALVKVMGKKTGSADILLGQARAEGKWWTTSVELNTEGTYQLYALAEKNGSTSDPSNPITVQIKDNTAVLQDVTINAGWNSNVKSNPKIGIPAIAVSQGYDVYVDAIFTNPVDTSTGNPQLLFAINDESIDLSQAGPDNFKIKSTMTSNEAPGQQKSWSGNFYVDFDLSGDLKAYIYYYTEGKWHLVPVVQIAILIDPSGTITDSHTGQPIQGVRAECEYEVSSGNWQRWPAENFGQVNPQLTDETGHYGWDVPAGNYRVRFSHPLYNTVVSETVVVPPPKTDLNLGLISLTAGETPGIKTKTPGTGDVGIPLNSTITVEFTKDMNSTTVTTSNFVVKNGTTPIEGTISGTGRIFTFTPAASLAGTTTYTVQLTADIKDTFGNALEPAEWSFTTVTADSTVITVTPQLAAYAVSSAARTVNVTFTGKITAQSLPTTLLLEVSAKNAPNTAIASVEAAVGEDGSFSAVWPIPVSLAVGEYIVRVYYDGQRWGNGLFQILSIPKPTADKPDGTSFDTQPLQVALTSANGTDIYYTLDGSIPDSTNPAQRYTGAITIEHSTVIKAIAVQNGVSSELASFTYTRTDECFIATASFGSKFTPAVVLLRQFRDKCLLTNRIGRAFVKFYYRNSPPIAHYIADRPALRALVRGLLTPAVGAAYLALHPQTAALTLSALFLLFLLAAIRRRIRPSHI